MAIYGESSIEQVRKIYGRKFMKDNIISIVFKNIIGYDGRYMINNFGQIFYSRNKKNHYEMKLQKKNGYYYIDLWKNNRRKRFYVHRLVAKYFVYNYFQNKNRIVDHIDGNKLNNYYRNLEWITQKENVKRYYRRRLINDK